LPRENGNQDSIECDSATFVMTQNYCILIATCFHKCFDEGLVLSSVANLVHLCGEDVGSNPAWAVFWSLNKNIQYPVKSFAPYLGGRRGRVPSDSLRKFLQEVNLYNSFNIFFFFFFFF
jgi:hypothetical protein